MKKGFLIHSLIAFFLILFSVNNCFCQKDSLVVLTIDQVKTANQIFQEHQYFIKKIEYQDSLTVELFDLVGKQQLKEIDYQNKISILEKSITEKEKSLQKIIKIHQQELKLRKRKNRKQILIFSGTIAGIIGLAYILK